MALITQRFPFSTMLAPPRARTVVPRVSSTQVLLSRPPGYTFRGPLPNLYRKLSGIPTPISSVLHENKLLGSVLGGGGATPTQWTSAWTGGTDAPVASIWGSADGASAYTLTVTAARQGWYQVVALTTPNQLYAFSVLIEAVTGSLNAQEVLVPVSLPAGAVLSYPPCTANPSGGESSFVQPGVLVAQVQLGATTGNATVRLGIGCASNVTGSVTISRPQAERGATRGTFVPTTTATVSAQDFTASGGLLTLSQPLAASEIVLAEYPTMLASLLG